METTEQIQKRVIECVEESKRWNETRKRIVSKIIEDFKDNSLSVHQIEDVIRALESAVKYQAHL